MDEGGKDGSDPSPLDDMEPQPETAPATSDSFGPLPPPPCVPPASVPSPDGQASPQAPLPTASEPSESASAVTSSARARVGGSWADEDQITAVYGKDEQQKRQEEEEPAPVAQPPEPVAQPQPVPPSRVRYARKLVIATAALIGVLAIVVALALPKRGSLVVTVAGPGNAAIDNLKVLVDEEVKCEASPCKVDGLAEGSHIVQVQAEGYPSMPARAVTIESGKDAVLDLLFSDERAAGTEARAAALSQPEPKGGTARAELKAGRGAKRADVMIECAGEDGMLVELPTAVDVSADKPCTVIATRKGYREFRKVLTFEEVKNQKTFRVALVKGGGKGKARGRKHKPKKAAAKGKATGGKGTLRISSNPRSAIVVNGRPLGFTPTSRTLKAGTYMVVFSHPQHGRKTVTVRVPAGGTAAASVRFP